MTASAKLFLLALITATIYLSGCNKTTTTPATIVGTWGIASQEEKLFINGTVKFDTVVLTPPGQTALTFTADGYYLELTGHNQYGGAYSYTGGVLSLFDTANGLNKWIPYSVSTLTENKLSLIVARDTISLAPIDSIGWEIANFTR
jgi:hypothetical protein